MSILITALLSIWTLVALLMILVILMQRPKSEGLGAAFGGGVTENIFGAQTTNVLVKFTSYLAGFFFLVTFVLSILYAHQSTRKSVLREELMKDSSQPAPSASPAVPGPAASVSPGSAASPSASASAPAATPSPANAATTPAASPAGSPKKP